MSVLQGHTVGVVSCIGSDGILAGSSAHTVRLWRSDGKPPNFAVILAESCQLSSGQTVKLSPVAVKIRRLSAGTFRRASV